MKIPKIALGACALGLCGGLMLPAQNTPTTPAASASASSDGVIMTPVSGKHTKAQAHQTAAANSEGQASLKVEHPGLWRLLHGGKDLNASNPPVVPANPKEEGELAIQHPGLWRLLHGGRDLDTNITSQAAAQAQADLKARQDAEKAAAELKAQQMTSKEAAAKSEAEQAAKKKSEAKAARAKQEAEQAAQKKAEAQAAREKLAAEKAARQQVEADLKAKQDAEKKLAEQRVAAAKAAMAVSQKPATSPTPAVVNNLANPPGFQPMPVPASPLPMSKEEKLNWLLSRYKADQITPEEYHKQRAAILAEP